MSPTTPLAMRRLARAAALLLLPALLAACAIGDLADLLPPDLGQDPPGTEPPPTLGPTVGHWRIDDFQDLSTGVLTLDLLLGRIVANIEAETLVCDLVLETDADPARGEDGVVVATGSFCTWTLTGVAAVEVAGTTLCELPLDGSELVPVFAPSEATPADRPWLSVAGRVVGDGGELELTIDVRTPGYAMGECSEGAGGSEIDGSEHRLVVTAKLDDRGGIVGDEWTSVGDLPGFQGVVEARWGDAAWVAGAP